MTLEEIFWRVIGNLDIKRIKNEKDYTLLVKEA